MKLYMAVTPDKYELPLAVRDSPKDLAEAVGIASQVILNCISHNQSGKRTGMKFIRIELPDD